MCSLGGPNLYRVRNYWVEEFHCSGWGRGGVGGGGGEVEKCVSHPEFDHLLCFLDDLDKILEATCCYSILDLLYTHIPSVL